MKTGFGKYIWITGGAALTTIFVYLIMLGLVVECQDVVCEVGVPCDIYCNVTNPTAKSIYLFNHNNWDVTFTPDIVEADIYWKYYGKWKYTNFTRETRAGNIPDDRKYVFVFPRYSTKEFKIVAVVNESTEINWDFGDNNE